MSCINDMLTYKISPEEEPVIVSNKIGLPYSRDYSNYFQHGIYVCRKCGNPVYKSLGGISMMWVFPNTDEEIPNSIKKIRDKESMKTKIHCSVCDSPLGYIFKGEAISSNNIRHCVNSISLRFLPEQKGII